MYSNMGGSKGTTVLYVTAIVCQGGSYRMVVG